MKGGDDGVYTGLAAILIESAALYSVWALIFIVAYARKFSGLHNIVIASLCEIQVSLIYSYVGIISDRAI